MRELPRLFVVLSLAVIACQNRGATTDRDTTGAPQPADSPAAASQQSEPKPAPAAQTPDLSKGKEPGTIPAKTTPTVTSENSIAAMRIQLQRLDSASAPDLQAKMKDHSKMLGDLLTTMRVEVQAASSPTKNSWLLAADSVEGDLDRLALANGEALRTAFREHRSRVLRLLDGFRVLVPARS